MTPIEQIVLLLAGLTENDRRIRDCPVCQSGALCKYHRTVGGKDIRETHLATVLNKR